MSLEQLNALDADAAISAFRRCCGSSRWAQLMAGARPFGSIEILTRTADAAWWALDRADWLEAFASHPQIGASAGGGKAGSAASAAASWSSQEQSGVASAAERTRTRLDELNRDYLTRFGYIFIVCATGRTGDEMLALLEQRLTHDPGKELLIASEEQRRITQLRLVKLLEQEPSTR